MISGLACILSTLSPAHAAHWVTATTYSGSSSGSVYNTQPQATGGTWASDGSSNLSVTSKCNNSTAVPGANAAATTSGTVTTTFTWTLDSGETLTSNPPPDKLMVQESASAIWSYGDDPGSPRGNQSSGSDTDSKIGDIPDNSGMVYPARSGGKKGSRIKAYDSSSGSFTVTCDLLAKVKVTAGTTYTAKCDAAVTYSIGISTVEIVRSTDGGAHYSAITGDNAKCLPGQGILLAVSGADSGTYYQYSIAGKTFKDYSASASSAVLTPMATADYQQTTCHYYWADSGAKKVSCTVSVNGTPASVEATITSNQLSGVLAAEWGDSSNAIRFDFSNSEFGLYGDPSEPQTASGINFQAGVNGGVVVDYSDRSVLGNGSWQTVQLVIPGRTITSTSSTQNWSYNGQSGLDGPYPFIDGMPASINASGGYFGDSPSQTLYSPSTVVSESVNDSFKMYLMFLPPGTDSKWVPVGYLSWSWQALVEPDATATGGWKFTSKSKSKNALVSSDTHPIWSHSNSKGKLQ